MGYAISHGGARNIPYSHHDALVQELRAITPRQASGPLAQFCAMADAGCPDQAHILPATGRRMATALREAAPHLSPDYQELARRIADAADRAANARQPLHIS